MKVCPYNYLWWCGYLLSFYLFLRLSEMDISSKVCRPDNFEPHNSLKPSFTNIQGLHSNFVRYKCFHKSNPPHILALCERNLDDSPLSGNFSVRSCLPLI